jgi:hypothetical protein
MPKYMAPGTPEADEAAHLERIRVKVEERRRWRELRDTYERCVLVAEQVWNDKLRVAEVDQRVLAVMMRDRAWADQPEDTPEVDFLDRGIPVPLFTPRDRLQFLKEVTTTLLIEASRRNLTATPEPKEEADPLTSDAVGAILTP